MLASGGGPMVGAALSATATSTQASTGAVAQVPLRLTVNGNAHDLKIDPRESLLDVLRERLDLTGTKKGCNQGACGACTVLVKGRRINSYLSPGSNAQRCQRADHRRVVSGQWVASPAPGGLRRCRQELPSICDGMSCHVA
jgi:ferredoxin